MTKTENNNDDNKTTTKTTTTAAPKVDSEGMSPVIPYCPAWLEVGGERAGRVRNPPFIHLSYLHLKFCAYLGRNGLIPPYVGFRHHLK